MLYFLSIYFSFKSAVADLIEDHEEGKGVLNLRHKTKEEKVNRNNIYNMYIQTINIHIFIYSYIVCLSIHPLT